MWVVVVVVEGRGGGLSHGKRSALEFCLMDDLDFLIEISVTLNNRTEQSKNSLLVTTVDNWFKYRSKVKRQSDRLTEPSAKCDAIRQSVHSSSPLAAAWLTPVFVCLRACLRVCVFCLFWHSVQASVWSGFSFSSNVWPSDLDEQSLSQLVIKTLPGFRRRDASFASALALSEGLNTDRGPSPWEVHGEGLWWDNSTDVAPLWFRHKVMKTFFFQKKFVLNWSGD